MPIQRKAKGARNEHRSRRLLEAAGYAVTRSAGSLGLWDLIGIGPTDVVLVQTKSNRWPSAAERAALTAFRCPPGVRRLIHRWRDHRREPDVQAIEEGRGLVPVPDRRERTDATEPVGRECREREDA